MAATAQALRLTDSYRARLKALVRVADHEARQDFRDLDLAEISESYGPIRDRVTAAVVRAQIAAVRLTAGYLGAFLSAELGEAISPPILLESEYVGKSYGGQPLSESLESPRIAMLVAIRDGQPDPRGTGLKTLLANVDLDVKAAARAALHDQIVADDRIEGWTRAIRGTCAACAGLSAESVSPPGTPLEIHPNCECVSEPIVGTKAPGSYEQVRAPHGREASGAPKLEPVEKLGLMDYVNPGSYLRIQKYLRGQPYESQGFPGLISDERLVERTEALAKAIREKGKSWPEAENFWRVTTLPDEILKQVEAGESVEVTEPGFFSVAGPAGFNDAYWIAMQTHGGDASRLVAFVVDPDHRPALSTADLMGSAVDEYIFPPGTKMKIERKLTEEEAIHMTGSFNNDVYAVSIQ